MSITVEINGVRRSLPDGADLIQAIKQAIKDGSHADSELPCVVAVNGIHVPREQINAKKIFSGDAIEILTVRQGG